MRSQVLGLLTRAGRTDLTAPGPEKGSLWIGVLHKARIAVEISLVHAEDQVAFAIGLRHQLWGYQHVLGRVGRGGEDRLAHPPRLAGIEALPDRQVGLDGLGLTVRRQGIGVVGANG